MMTQSSDFSPGDLVGFQTSGVFAALIRFGQRLARVKNRNITHIAIVVDCFTGSSPIIVQSVRRVNSVPLSSYGETPHIRIPFPGEEADRHHVVEFANSEIGRKYGVASVISRAINILTPPFINFTRGGDCDCSALGARAFEHGGVILKGRDPFQYMPGQLADEFGAD